MHWIARTLALVALALLLTGPTQALAAGTENADECVRPPFRTWLAAFEQDALTQGISARTLDAARPYMVFDASMIKKDHAQGVFQQSFLQFSDRMASNSRILGAQKQLKLHADLLKKIQADYGVPPSVLLAFWALESDFGANTGNTPILRAVTTLAYDCRRGDTFRAQLIAALKLIERGDIQLDRMSGSWAGELGGVQFTPEQYLRYGVDADGDGRRDLVNSLPDMLASAANLLVGLGWKKGELWLQEVRVPQTMPWQEADLTITHPVSQWIAWGAVPAYGRLPSGDAQASLILPMGRLGPAFLAYDNFKAYLGWNSAIVYSTTAAYLATRISGAPPMARGDAGIDVLTPDEMTELQGYLVRDGVYDGDVDGKLGNMTRAGVRKSQLRLGLPADGYPTRELLGRLRGR